MSPKLLAALHEPLGTGPAHIPSLTLDPTDVIAMLLMVIFSMRRMDLKATEVRAFPAVDPARFERWKDQAIRSRSISVNASFLKIAINNAWFYGLRSVLPPLALGIGGFLIFFGWVAAMSYAWWLYSHSKAEAENLGIVVGKKAPADPAVRQPQG